MPLVTGPGIARAVVEQSNDALRRAIEGIAMLTRENIRLRAELADANAKIATLQAMVGRAYADTERP